MNPLSVNPAGGVTEVLPPTHDEHEVVSEPPEGSSVLGRMVRRSVALLRRRWLVYLLRLAILVAFIAAWQLASGKRDSGALIDEFYFGKPSQIAKTIWTWTKDGTLWDNSKVTLRETLIGFALGCGGGILIGFALGVSRFASLVLYPYVMVINSIPKLALTPMFLLWFGLGEQSKIALVVSVVFFLVFINTFSGAREVDQALIDVLRIMDAGRLQLHWKVTLPSVMSWVIAGLRVSVPYAFVAAVVGEMISSNIGLGRLIQDGAQNFNPSGMFAAITILVILSLLLNYVVTLFEKYALRWRAYSLQNTTAF